MFLVEIATVSKNIPQGRISYWSKQQLAIGSLISWTMRGKLIHGVVIVALPVQSAKQYLKSITYTIRELPADCIVRELFTATDMELLSDLAPRYLTTLERLLQEIISLPSLARTVEPNAVVIVPTASHKSATKKSGTFPRETLITTIDNTAALIAATSVTISYALSSKYLTHQSLHLSRAWIWTLLLRNRGVQVTVIDSIPIIGYQDATDYTQPAMVTYGESESVIREQLRSAIDHTRSLIDQGQRVAWWYERSLTASSLYCANCSQSVDCTSCGSVVSLSVRDYTNVLICRHCGAVDPHVPVVCPHCTTPLIIHVPGKDLMTNQLRDQGIDIPLCTSSGIEQLAMRSDIDAVVVPLLRSQLERPSFSVIQDVSRSLSLLAHHHAVHIHTDAQVLLDQTPLVIDYQLRQQLGFPPYTDYIKCTFIIPAARKAAMLRLLSTVEFAHPPKIVAGSTTISVTIDSLISQIRTNGTPIAYTHLSELLFALSRMGSSSGKMYPRSPVIDLPFF